MNTTRHGKIARLPEALRGQLNERMADGEAGHRLVAWLNELPEVRQVMAEDFEGGVINEQNLTNWRQGGHQDWRQEQLLGKYCVAITESPAAVTLKQLATLMTARYLMMMESRQEADPDWEELRTFCRDVHKFRQVEFLEKRVELESAKLAFQKECAVEQKRTVADRVVEVLLTLGPEVKAALARGKAGEHSTTNIQRPTSKGGDVRPPASELPARQEELGEINVNQGLENKKICDGSDWKTKLEAGNLKPEIQDLRFDGLDTDSSNGDGPSKRAVCRREWQLGVNAEASRLPAGGTCVRPPAGRLPALPGELGHIKVNQGFENKKIVYGLDRVGDEDERQNNLAGVGGYPVSFWQTGNDRRGRGDIFFA